MSTNADATIFDLVRRIAARRRTPRVVSPEEFLAIACNRCGACCEEIVVPDQPEGIAAAVDDPALDEDDRRFLAALIPVRPLPGGWLYRCRHFRRDTTGAGGCAIYAERPAICRAFPGGRVVRTWPQCSWYVEIRVAPGDQISVLDSRLERGSAAGCGQEPE